MPDWYCILNLGRHSHFRFGASACDWPKFLFDLRGWFPSYDIMDCFKSQGVVCGEPFRHGLICEGPYHCYHAISDCELPVPWGFFGINEDFFGANVPFPSQKLRKPMQRCLSCVAYLADGSHSGRRIEQFSMLMGVYSTYQWELIVYLKMGVSYKNPR